MKTKPTPKPPQDDGPDIVILGRVLDEIVTPGANRIRALRAAREQKEQQAGREQREAA